MIKLKFGDIRKGEIFQSLGQIAQLPLDQKWAYAVAKIMRKLNAESMTVQELFLKLVKQYAVLDEKGEVAPHNGPGTFKIREEAIAEWQTKIAQFDETDLELSATKIPLQALEKAKLPAVVYLGLEPFLTDAELAVVENKTA